MDPALKEALDKLGLTQAQAIEGQEKAAKELREAVEADSKKRDATYDAKIAKLQAELDKFEPISKALVDIQDKAKAEVEARVKFQEQIDRIETEVKRPRDGEKTEAKTKAEEVNSAFFEFMRRGKERITRERLNVLTVSDDTTGGYLAPAEYVKSIIEGIVEYSPMRGLVTVDQTNAKQIEYPKRTGVLTAVWVSEIGTRSETTGMTWGLETIPVHEMTAEVYVSYANLEDSAFSLESLLKRQFVEQFGVLEGSAIISGTGVGQIQGFLNATVGGGSTAAGSGGTVAVNSGAATTVTADGILTLKYAIKTGYATNGSFVLNRGTLSAIRKLKDGNGQYLWVAGLAQGRPNAIDGDPYVEAPDMPALGAGLKAMAYGDWKRAYILVDRLAIAVMRDDYTRASSGQVKFVARRRLGGQIVNGEAIAIMTTSV
ncbi:MAG: phage major capsid protein [Armatimonadota bacterium]|nr:phage major capsid protein [Armatimonadota bacterium]